MRCRTCRRRYPRRLRACPACGGNALQPSTSQTDRLPALTPVHPPTPPLAWRWVALGVAATVLQIIAWLTLWPIPTLSASPRRGNLALAPLYWMVVGCLLGLVSMRYGARWQRIACAAAVVLAWALRWSLGR